MTRPAPTPAPEALTPSGLTRAELANAVALFKLLAAIDARRRAAPGFANGAPR